MWLPMSWKSLPACNCSVSKFLDNSSAMMDGVCCTSVNLQASRISKLVLCVVEQLQRRRSRSVEERSRKQLHRSRPQLRHALLDLPILDLACPECAPRQTSWVPCIYTAPPPLAFMCRSQGMQKPITLSIPKTDLTKPSVLFCLPSLPFRIMIGGCKIDVPNCVIFWRGSLPRARVNIRTKMARVHAGVSTNTATSTKANASISLTSNRIEQRIMLQDPNVNRLLSIAFVVHSL